MRGGKAKIQVRKAFLYYTLRRLGIAHRHAVALWLSLALLGGVLLTNLLKLAYERPRPSDFVSHAARVFTSSFPSGRPRRT
jgi:membrane-associated phospholipid phosphatase